MEQDILTNSSLTIDEIARSERRPAEAREMQGQRHIRQLGRDITIDVAALHGTDGNVEQQSGEGEAVALLNSVDTGFEFSTEIVNDADLQARIQNLSTFDGFPIISLEEVKAEGLNLVNRVYEVRTSDISAVVILDTQTDTFDVLLQPTQEELFESVGIEKVYPKIIVTGTARIRENTAQNGAIIEEVSGGALLLLESEPIEADGFTWYRVSVNGEEGWVAVTSNIRLPENMNIIYQMRSVETTNEFAIGSATEFGPIRGLTVVDVINDSNGNVIYQFEQKTNETRPVSIDGMHFNDTEFNDTFFAERRNVFFADLYFKALNTDKVSDDVKLDIKTKLGFVGTDNPTIEQILAKINEVVSFDQLPWIPVPDGMAPEGGAPFVKPGKIRIIGMPYEFVDRKNDYPDWVIFNTYNTDGTPGNVWGTAVDKDGNVCFLVYASGGPDYAIEERYTTFLMAAEATFGMMVRNQYIPTDDYPENLGKEMGAYVKSQRAVLNSRNLFTK